MMRRRSTIIGLDIGDHTVRAVRWLRSAPDRPAYRAVRYDRREPGDDGDEPARSREEAIRRCMKLIDFKESRAATALSPPDVELHTLELPAAVSASDPAELARAVQWEVERLATKGSGALETRHWVLPRSAASAPNALGVAARRETVLGTVAACAAAGLVCTGIDASAAALCRFGGRLRPWTSDDVWGILDLGYRETRLMLCVDEVPVLIREAGPGGAVWTQRIADALNISIKAAEVQKRDVGIALTGRGGSAAPSTAAPSELGAILTGILRSELNNIAAEIKLSYEYVLSCYPGRKAADLVLVGGGAATRNLPEFLTSALGIGVFRASTCLDQGPGRWRPVLGYQDRIEDFALAIGLTLSD